MLAVRPRREDTSAVEAGEGHGAGAEAGPWAVGSEGDAGRARRGQGARSALGQLPREFARERVRGQAAAALPVGVDAGADEGRVAQLARELALGAACRRARRHGPSVPGDATRRSPPTPAS